MHFDTTSPAKNVYQAPNCPNRNTNVAVLNSHMTGTEHDEPHQQDTHHPQQSDLSILEVMQCLFHKETRMPFSRRQPPACFDLVDCCDLDLDPSTFISEADLDMRVTYLYAKNYVNRSSSSKVIIRKKRTLTFGCCDLAFDPMTFTSDLDLDVVVNYLHPKN